MVSKRVSSLVVNVAVTMILTSPAYAQPTGLVTQEVTSALAESLELKVCNLFVQFSSSQDELLNIGFSKITADDPAGFFQHQFGSDTPPNPVWFALFPDLELDSYVTLGPIGGGNATSLDPDWDTALFNTEGHTEGGWFNSNPMNNQGIPNGNLQVLIGQFTVHEGFNVYGELRVFDGDGSEKFQRFCFSCFTECDPVGDIDGDGCVTGLDLGYLLGAWGPHPSAPGNLNGDGEVNALDLSILLGNWGPCH